MGFLRSYTVAAWLLGPAWVLVAQTPGQVALLQKARSVYYSLARERMNQFRSQLRPDWHLLLQEQQVAADVLETATAKLSGIEFNLAVDRKGIASITHTTVSAENEQVSKGLSQVYSGMEQMTTGFFQTWSAFMINPPLPEEGTPFHLEQVDGWYVITYREGESQIETTLGKDLAVSSMKVISKEFSSTINPRFMKTRKGYVLTGYQADYLGAGGEDRTELSVGIENEDVEGLVLPRRMDLRGSYNLTPFHVKVSFEGMHASKY